ncbi:Pfkb domain-containing protein [Novosphingobium sp. Rr 2-17]|uniref:PfkB family carbohydrate kinase n=1 Tax=Novosphingobium sp. Rr 2-17 TaxID=555793 RepID=UPI0002699BC7|nr:PfkB family carbohydrate kinase [Novosphingobium sp. Rr 2-17]EIZ78798.1 Pfkb domain-containing protein [Novosphingobium sp. Rr 2-17]
MSVCVFGSLSLDIAPRLPERAHGGQTLLVDNRTEVVGGRGPNQAIASARFGAVTAMAGADRLALAAHGLEAVGPDTRVLLCQMETDIAAIATLFRSKEAASVRKIIRAAPAVAQGAELFDLADMLIFNQSQFASFLGLDREPETVEDLYVARRLLTKPNQAVVVTLGPTGSSAIWEDRAIFVPAFTVDAVTDTSGAGDCFCGVVAACVDLGIGPEDALRFANAAAALFVQAHGAAPSIPHRAEIDSFLEAAIPR